MFPIFCVLIMALAAFLLIDGWKTGSAWDRKNAFSPLVKVSRTEQPIAFWSRMLCSVILFLTGLLMLITGIPFKN